MKRLRLYLEFQWLRLVTKLYHWSNEELCRIQAARGQTKFVLESDPSFEESDDSLFGFSTTAKPRTAEQDFELVKDVELALENGRKCGECNRPTKAL